MPAYEFITYGILPMAKEAAAATRILRSDERMDQKFNYAAATFASLFVDRRAEAQIN